MAKSSNNMEIRDLPMVEEKTTTKDLRIMRCSETNPDVPTINIMFVGLTGAGKTTLINSMINYIYGVEYKENFRYKLIPDEKERNRKIKSQGQTSCVNVYKIGHKKEMKVPLNLTLIDTPGFGDEGGLKHDDQISKQIEILFTDESNGVSTLNCVAFTMRSSTVRLTPSEQYIIDCILKLFGNDIGENIVMMLPFVDNFNQDPEAIQVIKDAEIPHKKFYKFNNSSLFSRIIQGQKKKRNDSSDSDEDGVDTGALTFNRTFSSLKRFFKTCEVMEANPLEKTKTNLQIRESLKVIIDSLKNDIRQTVLKLNQVEQESTVVLTHARDLELNKEFEYEIDQDKVVSVDLDPGTYVTNCLDCNFTCHYPCAIPDDGEKYGCAAMKRSSRSSRSSMAQMNTGRPTISNSSSKSFLGSLLSLLGSSQSTHSPMVDNNPTNSTNKNHDDICCIICEGKCVWHRHKNMPYRLEIQTDRVTKTSDDLKTKYLGSKTQFTSAMDIFERTVKAIFQKQAEALNKINMIIESKKQLQEVALRPEIFTTAEYVDKMIRAEEGNKKISERERNERIQQLKNLKEKIELLDNIEKGENPISLLFEGTKRDIMERAQNLKVGDDILQQMIASIDNVIQNIQNNF